MGEATEDLLDGYFNDADALPFIVMCPGCGELVRDEDTRFVNGKDCCIKCE